MIGIILAIFLIPTLIISVLYLSREILYSYFNQTETTDIRSSILLLSALLGAIGIPLFIWRTIIAAQQANTTRDRAYTELFTKAIEQLGVEKPSKVYKHHKYTELEDEYGTLIPDSKTKQPKVLYSGGEPKLDKNGNHIFQEIYVPNIEVRIGAIYALERIMKNSEKDAPAIVDTLAAYIRENCGKPDKFKCQIPSQMDGQSIEEWMKSMDNYIGHPKDPRGHTLVARARAFTEKPNINRSDIRTALTVLGRRPDYLKFPDQFRSKKIKKPDLNCVNFQGWDLQGVDLSYCSLRGAKMQGADLRKANMQGAKLHFAKMQVANLKQANLKDADLKDAKIQGAEFIETQTQKANFTGAKMQRTYFAYAQLQGAKLKYAKMHGSRLSTAQLQGVNLFGAKIDAVKFNSADITATSIIWVDLTKAYFTFEELQTQLPKMFGHKVHTILPEGMEHPHFWSEVDIHSKNGKEQYNKEWLAFKQKMGIE